MMMNKVLIPVAGVALLLVLVASGMFYQLDETEQAIITQFGEPVGEAITEPGLNIKLPFIQKIERFEKRILEWDGSPDEIPTLDKRFIKLDTTARWRIAQPLRFLQAVGDQRSAQSRLDDLIDSAARDVVSDHLLIQSVRNFSRELPAEERELGGAADVPDMVPEASLASEGQTGVEPPVATEKDIAPEERLGRDRLTQLMVAKARENLPNLGIELIDVRIKSINYVSEVEQRVYERMISERQRIAARFRSVGDGVSARIQGEKERELDRLSSEAYRQAQEIIGKADAEAAGIYAAAYNVDPEFYAFFQTLEAYKETFQKNSSLLLTTDSDFYRYLKQADRMIQPVATVPKTPESPLVRAAGKPELPAQAAPEKISAAQTPSEQSAPQRLPEN